MYDPGKCVEKYHLLGWQWDEWVERANLTVTHQELIGLLKGYGPRVLEEAAVDHKIEVVLEFFGNFPPFHREMDRHPDVEMVGGQLLTDFLRHFGIGELRKVPADVLVNPIQLLMRSCWPREEPHHGRLTKVAENLVFCSTSWEEEMRRPLYALLLNLREYDSLLSTPVGSVAVVALQEYVFGSQDFRRKVPNPSQWTVDDLELAMRSGFPDWVRKAATTLCVLSVRSGLWKRT